MLISKSVISLCETIRTNGGRAFLVGGWVRDFLRGADNVDYDLEVYGIAPELLREILDAAGTVNAVGEAFTVYKVKLIADFGLGIAEVGDVNSSSTPQSEIRNPQSPIRIPQLTIDVSLPRRESKNGRGHRGFVVTGDPSMSYEEACSRRDFTINAIMYDPLTAEFIDPFNGRADLEKKILRVVNPATFIEDSLRVLRAMQFAARFEFKIDPATVELCRSIDLSDLPAERIWAEVEKWLLQSGKPSIGFWAAIDLGITEKLWPEIHALIGCPQEYEWHPEGWSFSELSFQPRITSSAQSMWVDNIGSRSMWEFLSASPTHATMVPVTHSTSATESLVNTFFDSLTLTPHARTDRFDSPTSLSPTILTNIKCLVWSFEASAISTDEVFRVMFKIPFDYMRPVMLDAINDLEIVRRIIHPISIFVMNMLSSDQGATKYELHDNPVDANSSVTTSTTRVHVSSIVVDARTTPVDGYVLFDYDLAVKRNSNFLHNQESDINYRLFQVELGDVSIHTAMVIDEARKLIDDLPHPKKLAVMLGALCHDFGKPATTEFEDGRIRSKGHEDAGIKPTEDFLNGINLQTIDGYDVRKQVIALVADHLAPGQFFKSHENGQKVSDGAFRRLAQRCEPDLLYRVSRADCLGRTGNFKPDAMEWFIAKVNDLKIPVKAPEPILMGRHVMELGIKPGPRIGEITKAVYELQLDGKVNSLEEAIEAAEKIMKVPSA